MASLVVSRILHQDHCGNGSMPVGPLERGDGGSFATNLL